MTSAVIGPGTAGNRARVFVLDADGKRQEADAVVLVGTDGSVVDLSTLSTSVDGLEALITATNAAVDGLEGYTDGLEAALAGTVLMRGTDGVLTVLTSITRPSDTNAYAVGDAFANSTSAPTTGGFTFASAARAAGKSVILTDLIVVNSNPAATPLQGELHIFDTAVTAVNDNAAFAISGSEALTTVAIIPFVMGVGANNNRVHLQNLGISLTGITADFRFLVRVTNAYTPASAEVLSFRAKFLPVD